MEQKRRQEQIAAFFQDYEEEVQKLARQGPLWDSTRSSCRRVSSGRRWRPMQSCWSGSSTTGSERGKRSGRSSPAGPRESRLKRYRKAKGEAEK
jgi:hypothetical protein